MLWPSRLYFTCTPFLLAISPILCIISPHIWSWSFSFALRLQALTLMIAAAAITADATLSFTCPPSLKVTSYCRARRSRSTILSVSWFPHAASHLSARLPHIARGPVVLDVREHSPHFLVGQLAAKGRHVALVFRRRVRRHQARLCR